MLLSQERLGGRLEGSYHNKNSQGQQREAGQVRLRGLQHLTNRQAGDETASQQQLLPDDGDQLHLQQAACRTQDLLPALPSDREAPASDCRQSAVTSRTL